MKNIILILLLGLAGRITAFSQSDTGGDCSNLLDEYEELVDTFLILSTEYYENPNDKGNRNSKEIIQNKIDMNAWYTKWNSCTCKEDEVYLKRYEAIEQRKKDFVQQRYGL